MVDQATAARRSQELEAEIAQLRGLDDLAKRRPQRPARTASGASCAPSCDDDPQMNDSNGDRRKLIIFTEHRDTLNYLDDRISQAARPKPTQSIEIHGGVDARSDARPSGAVPQRPGRRRSCVATDAAGEGVNLQCANLMVNYDLPWNPNRLEQRFGRIHRIGQTEVCQLWNLVAHETREGQVFKRLFEKLEQERATLGGKVFDILGKAFERRSLKELLMEAIRYGEREDVRARLYQQMDLALDRENIQRIMEREAIGCEHLTAAQVFQLKEKMQQAEALRLQPHFVQAFFAEAFRRLGGDLKRREEGRFEISYVPQVIVQRDRVIGARAPVVEKYSRVCFEKQHVRPPGRPPAALIAPGHALMDTTVESDAGAIPSAAQAGRGLREPQGLGHHAADALHH